VARLFERAAIVGVGLIGGSLALAAKRAGLIGHVVGVGRSEANLCVARERGMIDRAALDLSSVGPVDLVVLAVPVGTIVTVARELAAHLKPGTVVSDVGSVKEAIVTACEAALPPGCPFVGAHPIAGSEESGAAAANEELFRGARCVLTPTDRTAAGALTAIEALWRGVGAEVVRMGPAEHDRALAWTSHLVHALAYSLAHAIEETDPGLFAFAGPSLRDATRVAASRPELWRDIFVANAGAVARSIEIFAAELGRLRVAIEKHDETEILRLLEAAVAARRRLGGPGE
jgi:prephenate dehydrogenase